MHFKTYSIFLIFLIISCKSNYTKYSKVEIYSESYYGTKERYNESIEGFVKKDAYIYVKIENEKAIPDNSNTDDNDEATPNGG